MITKWHGKVYQKNLKKLAVSKADEWHRIKMSCLKRDRFTCQRCDMMNSQGRGMTAHHLMPRSEGGADDLSNLITLCDPCHDFVEVNELRTRADIQGSMDTHIEFKSEQTKYKTDEGYHFLRPAWHKWVYGGGKKKS